MTLLEIKIKAIHDALTRHKGNKTKAAKELRVGLKTIRNYVAQYPQLKEFRIRRSKWIKERS